MHELKTAYKLHQCNPMSRVIRLIALSNLVYKNKTESDKGPAFASPKTPHQSVAVKYICLKNTSGDFYVGCNVTTDRAM